MKVFFYFLFVVCVVHSIILYNYFQQNSYTLSCNLGSSFSYIFLTYVLNNNSLLCVYFISWWQGACWHQSDLNKVHHTASGSVHPHRYLSSLTDKLTELQCALYSYKVISNQQLYIVLKMLWSLFSHTLSYCIDLIVDIVFFRGVCVCHQTHWSCPWPQSCQPGQKEHAIFCEHPPSVSQVISLCVRLSLIAASSLPHTHFSALLFPGHKYSCRSRHRCRHCHGRLHRDWKDP